MRSSEEASPPSSPTTQGVQHRKRDMYSQNRPVPSIQRFFKKGLLDVLSRNEDSESEDDEATDAETETQVESPRSSKDTGDAPPAQAATAQQNGGHRRKDRKADGTNRRSGRRSHKPQTVDDPVTRQKVTISDVGRKEYERAMRRADELDQGRGGGGDGGGPKRDGKQTRSKHFDAENILNLPFPPEEPLPASLFAVHPVLLPGCVVWALVTVIGPMPRWVSVLLAAWMAWFCWERLKSGMEDRRWERERLRGGSIRQSGGASQHDGNEANPAASKEHPGTHQPYPGIKEGAEWLNTLVDRVWEVMDPALFSSMGSTLEDVMQASIPGFIHAVKVEDLAQGSTPLRLTGFRVLPDDEAQDLRVEAQKALRKQRLEENKVRLPHKRHAQDNEGADDDDGDDDGGGDAEQKGREGDQNNADKDGNLKKAGKPKRRVEEDAGGSYINLELGFLYRARPTANTVASKSRNAHLLIKFWVGARKLYTIPLPVWVEIKGLVGTVRARLQLTPDPPFVKMLTFSFMGLPRVGIEVVPLGINLTHVPFLSGFVQSSIDAACGEYCAPSSMTMDLGEILMGDSIKREVNAMGVLVIYVHRAFDLEKQDVRGSSDPYCTLSLAKYGKVQYATRVALDDLSPRWEERCVMLINPEAVRAREKVSIALWDSDRFSADDMLGRAEVDLEDLVKRPGRLFKRTDTLFGLTQEMKKQGTIQWSLGFFAKTPNIRKELREMRERDRQKDEEEHGDGRTEGHTDDKGDEDEEEHRNGNEGNKPMQSHNQQQAVAFEPPSPLLPSGILSLQVHQIAQLEVTDTKTSSSKRKEGEPGQLLDNVQDEEDTAASPSSYVTIILNDETVFRSRTKTLSSNPFFNAGTERFVRDWRRSLVMFVVKDRRLREEDAILGVVPIKLSDLFKTSSQVTQFFPLAGGLGHGRIRVSVLFRPVQDLSRHRTKLGWDVGTMRILSSPIATDFVDADAASALHLASLRAGTLAGSARIAGRRARHVNNEDQSTRELAGEDDEEDDEGVEEEAREERASSATGGAGSRPIKWRIHEEEFPVKIPARRRYTTSFVIDFRSARDRTLGRSKVVAMCILWLQDFADDDIVDEVLPIWRPVPGGDLHRLRQNYHHYKDETEAEHYGVERMGYLRVRLQFKSGVGKIHTKFDSNVDAKDVMEAWRCCVAVGLRSVTGDFVNQKQDENGQPIDERENRASDEIGTEDGGSDDDADGDSPTSPTGRGHRRTPSGQSRGSKSSADNGNGKGESGTGDDDDDELTMLDKLKKWTEERKELHRQHKGLKQYKVVRTASWIGRGVKDRGHRAYDSFKMQDRRAGQVETEI